MGLVQRQVAVATKSSESAQLLSCSLQLLLLLLQQLLLSGEISSLLLPLLLLHL